MFLEQDTQPLPVLRPPEETPAARFRRLKAIADATGRRLLFVYLEEERRRSHYLRAEQTPFARRTP